MPSGCRPAAIATGRGLAATPERCAYRSLLLPRRVREGELPCNFVGHDDLGAPLWTTTPARQNWHPAGASPSREQHSQTSHRQHPRPRGQAQNRTAATSSQIKFFHRMWTNLFAVAGIREHPPAGGDSQEGAKRPLFASRSERACEQPPLCGGS